MMMFQDRTDAGRKLAKALGRFGGSSTVILALPRGGIVLGVEVARYLDVPLDVILVRKIGHPTYAEYAIGAVAEGEEPEFDQTESLNVGQAWLEHAVEAARQLIRHRHELYYDDDYDRPDISGKTVLIVDDGIATGMTMKAAVLAAKNKGAKHIVVATPVASSESVSMLEDYADEVIVLDNPANFIGAVGAHYREFEQVDDEEVKERLGEVQNDTQHILAAS